MTYQIEINIYPAGDFEEMIKSSNYNKNKIIATELTFNTTQLINHLLPIRCTRSLVSDL